MSKSVVSSLLLARRPEEVPRRFAQAPQRAPRLAVGLIALLAACDSDSDSKTDARDSGGHDPTHPDHDAGHLPSADAGHVDFSDASHEPIPHETHEAGTIAAILSDGGVADSGDPRPQSCPAQDAAVVGSAAQDAGLTGSCFVTPTELAQHGTGGTAGELAQAFAIGDINASLSRALLVFPHTCGVALSCKLEEDPNCESGFVSEFKEERLACYDDVCLDATLDVYACYGLIKRCDCLNACDKLLDRQAVACAKYQGG